MADTDPNSSQDPWTAAQRRLLDEFVRQEGGTHETATPPSWVQLIQKWYESAAAAADPGQQAVMRQICELSRMYSALGEQLARMSAAVSMPHGQGAGWQAALDGSLEEMKAILAAASHAPYAASPAAPWSAFVEFWQRAASGTGLPAAPPDAADLNRIWGTLGALPALGPAREQQEKIQRATRLWQQCLEKSRAWQAALAMRAGTAVDELRTRILALAERGEKITSLRQLYELWIDSNEAAFAEYVFTDEYAMLYSEMVNAWVEWRRHARTMTDDLLRLTDLPTSAGIATLQERQHQSRRDTRAVQARQDEFSDTLGRLREDLDAVRATLAGRGDAAQSPPAAGKPHGPGTDD